MATLYTYICDSCTLTASVSGRKSSLKCSERQTYYCAQCCDLFDAVCNELEIPVAPIKCYNCHSDSLATWCDGQACPQCQGDLHVDPYGVVILVD